MSHTARRPLRADRGFTLVELMITLVVFSLIAGTIVSILIVSSMQGAATSNETAATEQGRAALDMMSRDLRCAGFGTDITGASPQPPIAYVDSMQILINADLTPYPDTASTALGIPLAYDPNGSPRPKPLVGTSWTPTKRYLTGAELVRWTLDLNNDGAVNASDLAVADAADANHTRNPNDYELCREVYGDSTAGVKGNNGGARERIAVVKLPGGSQPPMFRVYLSGSTAAWDWSNGPVPANRLAEITRIELNVVATSANRSFFGGYSDTRLTTTVSEIRNAPNYSGQRYNISGIVFNDANKNHVKDGAEVGVTGASVMLGGYLTQTTSSTGTYSFDVPPGSYWLTQDAPANYGTFDNPDSFMVTVGPNYVKNLADTVRAGGTVNIFCYNDVDKNHSFGGSDQPLAGVVCNLLGTDVTDVTDATGNVSFFVPVTNRFDIQAVLPDSFVASTANPYHNKITNGQILNAQIGMYVYDAGTVSGTVFNDTNGNGTKDSGENGVSDAVISVVLADSTEVYAMSDGTGKYSMKLPANDPPKTYAYTLTCTPPPGFSSGSKMTVANVWLQINQVVNSKDFALGKFNTDKFDVNDPIRAMTLTDVIENDWLGQNTGFRRKDLDIVTGSANGTASRLAEWFNQYNASPLFKNNATSSMPVGQSIFAMATDTLKAGSGGITRPAIVVGMRYAASGNWAIWYPKDAIGNCGFLPNSAAASYLTSDNGDVTAVATLAPTAAGTSPGVVVGTNSPTAFQGVVELWTAASHTNPAYVRSQTISYNAGFPGGPQLGAVSSVIVSDFYSGVAGTELLVGTQTGFYSGQVFLFKQVSGVWTYTWGQNFTQDAVTAMSLADIDHDGRLDIVVGTQDSHTTGHLMYFRNKGGGTPAFDNAVTRVAPGIVTQISPADFNGDGHHDLVIGWRDSDTTFGGGVQIWYVSGTTFPSSGVDPSGGMVNNWVTDLFVADVNWGAYPVLPTGTIAPDIVGSAQKSANNSYVFTLLR